MRALSKEAVKDILRGNNFQNTDEVLAFLKDAFKDMLQEGVRKIIYATYIIEGLYRQFRTYKSSMALR